MSALAQAAWNGCSRDVVACFIARGADPNKRDERGGTALQAAVHRDHAHTVTALLDYGADINACDDDGDAIIHQAVFSHSDNTLEILLQRGAAYSANDSMGNSILHLAALTGGIRTLELLLVARLVGLNPAALNRQGRTAVELAKERVDKPEQFLAKLQGLCDSIQPQASMHPHSQKKVVNAMPDMQPPASSTTLLPLSARLLYRKASARIAHWTWSAWPTSSSNWTLTDDAIYDLQGRIRRDMRQHRWLSICLQWAFGIVCGGLIYLLVFSVLELGESWQVAVNMPFGRLEHRQGLW